MLTIKIERKDDDLGFSIEHSGIYNHDKKYEGTFGNVEGLRQSLNNLLDVIEEKDAELATTLGKITDNFQLPSTVRIAARDELQRRESA